MNSSLHWQRLHIFTQCSDTCRSRYLSYRPAWVVSTKLRLDRTEKPETGQEVRTHQGKRICKDLALWAHSAENIFQRIFEEMAHVLEPDWIFHYYPSAIPQEEVIWICYATILGFFCVKQLQTATWTFCRTKGKKLRRQLSSEVS